MTFPNAGECVFGHHRDQWMRKVENSRTVAAEALNVLHLSDIGRNMQFVGQEIVNKTDGVNYQYTRDTPGRQFS